MHCKIYLSYIAEEISGHNMNNAELYITLVALGASTVVASIIKLADLVDEAFKPPISLYVKLGIILITLITMMFGFGLLIYGVKGYTAIMERVKHKNSHRRISKTT